MGLTQHPDLPAFGTILSLGHNEVNLQLDKHSTLSYKRIAPTALPAQNMLTKLEEACSFIRQSLGSRGKDPILVHCLDGLDLAPAIVIAYLMQAKSLDYDAASMIVRGAKPSATPPPHFEYQLRVWESMGCSLLDSDGTEKLPYLLWKAEMRSIFQKQALEIKLIREDAEIDSVEEVVEERWSKSPSISEA